MGFDELLAEALLGGGGGGKRDARGLLNFEVGVHTTDLSTPEGKLYFFNISCGYICKVAFGGRLERPVLVEKGATPLPQLGVRLLYFPPEIQPPTIMTTSLEFSRVEELGPEEAWGRVEELALKWIVFYSEKSVDLVTAYTIYTWFHMFWPKKANLVVTGFYSTGKSAVGSLLKALGRYTVQTDPGVKTSEWEVALLQGTMLIDEAESLKRSHLSKLRKMHDSGLVISKMIGVRGGWSIISLELSSPVVLIGTHIPPDPALVSRGYILKMHYGEPREQPWPINSDEARMFRARMLKTVTAYYGEYVRSLESAKKLAEGYKLTMRMRDVFVPLCASALMARRPEACRSLYDYAVVSQVVALQVNPAYSLVAELALKIRDAGVRAGDFILVPLSVFYRLLEEIGEELGLPERVVKYVEQYFASAGYRVRLKGEWYLAFYHRDLETVTRFVDVNPIDLIYGGFDVEGRRKT